jgi:peptidoglycan/LPS O-acetylase OafA/YrhL
MSLLGNKIGTTLSPGPLTIGNTFDPRDNALNLLRLIFAILVILSHSLTLGGYRSEILWGYTTLGDIAVNAFFAVSGFLIAASATRSHVIRYLWQRFLRIFPAFWVCLIVTGVTAGWVGWISEGRSPSNYWTDARGPYHYVAANFLLKMNAYDIAGTPADVPYPLAWDGSLWTLRWEFYCYLLVAALAVTTLLRRHKVVLALWVAIWGASLFFTLWGESIPYGATQLLRFVPIFLAGVALCLYCDKVPDSRILFALAIVLFVVGTFLPNPDILAGPPLAYICVWAAIHSPGRRIGSKYDISYGTYIYAFVVAQVLAVQQIHTWGYLPYTTLTVILTLVLAALSCVLVERPALRLKRWSPRLLRRKTPIDHRTCNPPVAVATQNGD